MNERREISFISDILIPSFLNLVVYFISLKIMSTEMFDFSGINAIFLAFQIYGTVAVIFKFGFNILFLISPFNLIFGFFYFIYQFFKRIILLFRYIRQQIIKRNRRKALREQRKNPYYVKSYSLEEYLEKNNLTIDDLD